MIGPSSTVRVMLASRPVDFRKGMDGLAALVHEAMGAEPFGAVTTALSPLVARIEAHVRGPVAIAPRRSTR